MRILGIIDGLGSGGAQKQMVGLLNILSSEDGNDVMIMYYEREEFFLSELSNRVCIKSCNGKLSFSLSVFYYKLLGYRVVSFLDFPNLVNYLSSFIRRGVTCERNGDTQRYVRLGWRTLGTRFNRHVETNSLHLSRMFKFHYIPNLRDSGSTRFDEIKPCKDSSFVVLASLSPVKRPFELLQQLSISRDALPNDFSLTWVGGIRDGNYYKNILNFYNQNELNNIVVFHGETSEVDKSLGGKLAGVLVSSYEGEPNVIQDYIRNNLIVCGIRNIGLEMVADDRFLVENIGDLPDLFNNISRLSSEERKDIILSQRIRYREINNVDILNKWKGLISRL